VILQEKEGERERERVRNIGRVKKGKSYEE
jgi:hypothetical protein